MPGEQLSCVIIDKLPFAVPSDPVVEARIAAIRRRRRRSRLTSYQVPQAAIALKQGFGRLIRSRTDRGVLALLDQPHHQNALRADFFRQPAGLCVSPRNGKTWKGFSNMFEVAVEQDFRRRPRAPQLQGRCENVHGHNFKVQVVIEGGTPGRRRHAGGFYRREEPDGAVIDRAGSPVSERGRRRSM